MSAITLALAMNKHVPWPPASLVVAGIVGRQLWKAARRAA
jgi:hypothetical protein